MKFIINKLLLPLLIIFSIKTALYAEENNNTVKPFGYGIFQNELTATQPITSIPTLKLNYGDKILLRMWGSKNVDYVLMIEADGNIFIPDVGPVELAGLTLKSAQEKINKSIKGIYKNTVNIYTTIAETKPLSIFVAGFVNHPGRYEGHQSDTIIDFITKAGGIDPFNGSFRDVSIKRNNKVLKTYDLYDFLLNGSLEEFQFNSNDTIVVNTKGITITVNDNETSTLYEFTRNQITGSHLLDMLKVSGVFSHARVIDHSATTKKDVYLTLADFNSYTLEDGDIINFIEDKSTNTINVTIKGSISGQSSFDISRSSTLKEVLSFIEVDPKISNISAIHINRKSIANAQRQALDKNLNLLQQKILKSQSQSPTETKMRSQEAQMITGFIEKAQQIEPKGTIVVTNNGKLNDIHLENGDEIIIPDYTDVILVSGEVLSPNAFIYDKSLKAKDYINRTGSITEIGDPNSVLITHANGDVSQGTIDSNIQRGDQILVMPSIDNKTFAYSQDLIGLIYQIAVSSNILLSL